MADPLLLFDRAMIGHDPGTGHPESPDRLRVIESMIEALDYPIESPREAEREVIAKVHGDAHIDRIFALRDHEGRLDPDTVISAGSVRAARLAAGAAVTAVDAVFARDVASAFCLVRPPGHHAETDRAMGFCLFNNVAVAAEHARTAFGVQRVLIVDWDVHHGNGTQHAFYDDPGVLFFSTHQFPFYPGTGSLGEMGTGAGEGYTVNVPLLPGATDGDYARIFADVLEPIAEQYKPQLVLVSAGFDAHAADPLGGMELSADGFALLCDSVKSVADTHCPGKLVLLLEGGYDLDALSQSVRACTRILAGATPPEPATKTSAAGEASLRGAVQRHGQHWEL
jgi:acetoin utilization deacetylase AcuC-like enzyme